jgi:hypothetical protein
VCLIATWRVVALRERVGRTPRLPVFTGERLDAPSRRGGVEAEPVGRLSQALFRAGVQRSLQGGGHCREVGRGGWQHHPTSEGHQATHGDAMPAAHDSSTSRPMLLCVARPGCCRFQAARGSA